jgi:hypothetical protein
MTHGQSNVACGINRSPMATRRGPTQLFQFRRQQKTVSYSNMIIVRSFHAMMEGYRSQLRAQYGEKYSMRVSPYKSILSMLMKREQKKGPVELAQDLIALLRGKHKKVHPHVKALILSAALELEEAK